MRAFVIDESGESFEFGVRDVSVSPTELDDLLVEVDYSGVNFKDALVASPRSRVRRVPRLIGGVDAAGTVVTSTDPAVPVGTRVAVHGGELGVGRDGGFATLVYAPRRFLNALPDTISTREAMVIGTAGFTAMASVLALEAHGLAPGASVLVTGATGGVGSAAVTFLAARGYDVTASTGSSDEAPWLRARGAAQVIGRADVADRPERVLASERWDGAIDCIGGATLPQILRSLRYGAAVAASGLVAGAEIDTTVYPFITRAVSLLGVDAVKMPIKKRELVWSTLGEVVTTVDLEPLVDHVVTLEELPDAFGSVARGTTRGRILVTVSPRNAN
ncbi:MAG TPA: acryloyl-CoA reductase [Acidimicrobiales bacterium]|nr:acryloyl-CoA reductase [Acidimicrobiales bacterium]